MKHSDVEELARECGLIEPRDVWADLPADYRQALCSFAALVIEKAADQFELQPHVEMFRPSVADELRAMSAALQSGDRG